VSLCPDFCGFRKPVLSFVLSKPEKLPAGFEARIRL